MEYPGRVLDMGTYAYKGSDGQEAQQTKPQSIAEAEFRLSDEMYDIGAQSHAILGIYSTELLEGLAHITGGPKGAKVCLIFRSLTYGSL